MAPIFTVRATYGDGAVRSATSPVVIPWDSADPPAGLTATPISGGVRLSWHQPGRPLGGTLVGYRVDDGVDPTRQVTGTRITIGTLHGATNYQFTVRAVTRDPNGGGAAQIGDDASIRRRPVRPRID